MTSACTPATFAPSIFGTAVQAITASLVTGYSVTVPGEYRFSQPTAVVNNATFCNVTVTYTHPGEGDSVIVEAWLPPTNSSWNSLFEGVGGAGWIAGRGVIQYLNMAAAVSEGYATITTDAGLGSAEDPSSWGLVSEGNVNLYLLQNFGAKTLGEQALFGKSLVQSYYGTPPKYSYWNGCSQGGRQGLAIAQQYPTAYDGIVAGAPVVSMNYVGINLFWAQEWMSIIQAWPYGCEMDAITEAAVAACDGLDGVNDGIISNPADCLARFDPFSLVGTSVQNCSQTGAPRSITEAAASVVNATWSGPISAQGKPIWPGFFPGADLTGDLSGPASLSGMAGTNCTSGVCVGSPNALIPPWLKYLYAKDPSFDYSNLTHEEFDQVVHATLQQYHDLLDTNDPDLSDFYKAGGKILSFHGLADNIVAYGGSEKYYKEVSAVLPNVHDFFRLYPVPGLGHCFGGKSTAPQTMFAQLRAWVENGTAPETTPVSITDLEGKTQDRILCPYPQQQVFNESCGDAGNAECWSCSARERCRK
ncbi:tannase and feruloyl esterase [Thozetella sp. PMI_491]|nr:tannase and feruloyl esterase [Thozetella sp. PMI_491]